MVCALLSLLGKEVLREHLTERERIVGRGCEGESIKALELQVDFGIFPQLTQGVWPAYDTDYENTFLQSPLGVG